MGASNPTHRGAIVPLFLAIALALVLPASGGAAPGSASGAGGVLPPQKVHMATSGDDSELLSAIPISKQPNTRERVAMSLGPEDLEPLQEGERMTISAEVQISTTCVADEPRCVGTRYDINPTVSARVVLASSPESSAPAFGLSTTVKKLCKQQRPNRNHHCTMTVPNTTTTIGDYGELPCPPDACYVNLIVGAFNKKAKPTDRVVLGADRPDGAVAQDKGRLNIVQAGPGAPEPLASSSNELVSQTLPLTEGKKEKRRVVYSVPIENPQKGDVIAFDSSFVTGISALRFNTFISSRVILAEEPDSTDPTGLARSSSLLRGDATEANGFNCTLGSSGYTNPCTVVKAGATKITRDLSPTLYLNVVAAAKPLLVEAIDGLPEVSVAQGSGLSVKRYPDE